MKKLLLALFLGLILVLAACGGEEETQDDSTNDEATEEQTDEGSADSDEGETVDADEAEKVYQTNCATCHGGDLGGGAGPALTNVGADYSADEIVDIIKNGKGGMPQQSAVSDEDASLVANWLAAKE